MKDRNPSSHDSEEFEEGADPQGFFMQFWVVCQLSVGPIVSMIFYMAVQLINTYFIGHVNDPTLIAGVGMGNMLINVLAFAVMQGINGALETLISQSYGASQNLDNEEAYRRKMRKTCGIFYNRGRFISTILMIPIGLIFIYSEDILLGIGQDPEVSDIA